MAASSLWDSLLNGGLLTVKDPFSFHMPATNIQFSLFIWISTPPVFFSTFDTPFLHQLGHSSRTKEFLISEPCVTHNSYLVSSIGFSMKVVWSPTF